jgi:hypothetical protein
MWQKIHRVHSFVVILVMVVDGDILDNLKRIMVNAMVMYGGLIWETMVSQLVTQFGANRVSVFYGVRIRVIIQLKNQNVPFMVNVYCMSHHTNLVVQTLSKLAIVGEIDDVLQIICLFLSQPKKNSKVCRSNQHLGTWGLAHSPKH